MISVRKIKLYKEYSVNPNITLKELKEAMIRFYYPHIEEERLLDEMKRELIITPIRNSYGNVNTTIFSVNGSPPKGECILLHNFENNWQGDLIFIGNGKIATTIRNITIQKEVQKEDDGRKTTDRI